MDHSVETTLGRRSFLALLSAAAATGALPAPARGATSRAASGTMTGTARITPATIAAAEQIAGMSYTNAERALLAETLSEQLESFASRQTATLPEDLFPATVFNPVLREVGIRPTTTSGEAGLPRPRRKRMPTDETEVAFASIA